MIGKTHTSESRELVKNFFQLFFQFFVNLNRPVRNQKKEGREPS
jgi:hypothetical protein